MPQGGDPNLAEPGTTDEAASKADDDGSSVVYVHSDATYFEDLNKGCAAGIIRDSRGNFLFGFYIILGENEFIYGGGSSKAEAIAVRQTQLQCMKWWKEKKKGNSCAVLEVKAYTDSKNFMEVLNGSPKVVNKSPSGSQIKKIRAKAKEFKSYKIRRVPRGENESADALAEWGFEQNVKEGKCVPWEFSPDDRIGKILEKEKSLELFKKG